MNKYTEPIYIHFFEAHYRNTFRENLTDEKLCQYLSIASLLSYSFLFINNALIWESSLDFPKATKLIFELEKLGIVKLVSNFASRSEFIDHRRKLYATQKQMFPIYFYNDSELDKIPWPQNIGLINDYTTDVMINGFREDILYGRDSVLNKELYITEAVKEHLFMFYEKSNSYEGLNNNAYDNFLHRYDLKPNINFDFGKVVNYLYTKRYRNLFLNSKIIYGIPGFPNHEYEKEYDPKFDYRIFELILKSFYIFPISVYEIQYLKESEAFSYILSEIQIIICGITNYNEIKDKRGDVYQYSTAIYNKLKKFVDGVVPKSIAKKSLGIRVQESLYCIIKIRNSLEKDRAFLEGIKGMEIKEQKKILIIVSTMVELKVLLSILRKKKYFYEEKHINDYVYYLSRLIKPGYDVYIVKSQMGSGSFGGSLMTLQEANNSINPDAFIMAGICFGLNENRNSLGDIIVARQIWSYEEGKISGEDFFSRGNIMSTSMRLLSYFEASSITWKKGKVDFGLFVSGEKLVNSSAFTEWLRKNAPEAIAGDMESAGLVNVGYHSKKDWVLLKAICDWGDNKTDDSQEKAAKNVMEYLIHTIKNHF